MSFVFNVLLLVFAQPVLPATPATLTETALLERALTCRLSQAEVPTLLLTLARNNPHWATPAQTFALPAANLYRIDASAAAWGYRSSEIAVQPGRILLAVGGQSLVAVARSLSLRAIPFSPFERRVTDTRKLVAYTLHQRGMDGKILIGCEYAEPGGLRWIDQGFE